VWSTGISNISIGISINSKMKWTSWATLEGMTPSTDDHRESAFRFQWLSVLIQRYNAVAVLGTFTHTTPEDDM